MINNTLQNKKIGILTYHRFINYGGLLQAYALCRTLREKGADASVIDYRCEILENVGNSKLFCGNISYKRRIWKLLFFNQLRKKQKLFTNFIDNNLVLSDLNDEFDLYVAGSDQVWNSKWPYDPVYFLSFVTDNAKKGSYAASLGDRGIPDDKREFYRESLSSFSHLCVREESDKELLENVTGRTDVEVCLDPVFLLDKEAWEKIADTSDICEDYVLVYTVNEPENLLKHACAYAKKKGMRVYYLNPSFFSTFTWFKGKRITCASPEQFVGFFSKAKAVFTNSFHGTAFSLIFEKPLWVEGESYGNINRRATDILNRTGMTAGKLNEPSDNNIAELSRMREDSLQYIDYILR